MAINKFILLLLISCCFLQSNCMKRKDDNTNTKNSLYKTIKLNPMDQDLLNSCHRGDLNQVIELLRMGADPNTNEHNTSILIINMEYINNNIENNKLRRKIAEHLIKNGAYINNESYTFLLIQAIDREDHETLNLLLKYGASRNFKIGNRCLNRAIMSENISIIKMLIDAGANLNQDSLLSAAILYGYLNSNKIIKILLWSGAKVTCEHLSDEEFRKNYKDYKEKINKKYNQQYNLQAYNQVINNIIFIFPKELTNVIFDYYIESNIQSKRQILVDYMFYIAKNHIEGGIKLPEKISNLISSYYSLDGQDLENYCNQD